MQTRGPAAFVEQPPFTDPGEHADLLVAVSAGAAELSGVARNVNVHYRTHLDDLPRATRSDVNSRRLATRLRLDQERHAGRSLGEERPLATRVQGCCRDFTLLCVGILRAHGIPARSRVGFAPYLVNGWFIDHVIAEYWTGERWHAFDAEVAHLSGLPDAANPLDLQLGADFTTASQAWRAFRRGERSVQNFGVSPALPRLAGPGLVRNYVVHELAHRCGDELLLWDTWGLIADEQESHLDSADLIDLISELLVRADAGDERADAEAFALYRADERLNPRGVVLRHSPFFDRPPMWEALRGESRELPPVEVN